MRKICVIVPIYKVEAYLRRCIDSILGQTYSDFDLILVDDGSPDNCGAICDEYAQIDDRIHVIHQKNGGLSAARNAGIDWMFAYSDSQWLMFVDSDDWVHKDFLKCLFSMVTETGCTISACGIFRTDGKALPEGPAFDYVCQTADEYYCGNDLTGDTAVTAPGKLYHRSLFETLRFPVGKLHEDEFTTYRAVYEAGKVAVTSAQLYAYFQNTSGIMQSKWSPRKLDALEAFEQQIAFAEQTGNQNLRHCAYDRYLWGIIDQISQIGMLDGKEQQNREYLALLRKKLRNAVRDGGYAFNRENLVFYEAAYPVKPLWSAAHAVYNVIRKEK